MTFPRGFKAVACVVDSVLSKADESSDSRVSSCFVQKSPASSDVSDVRLYGDSGEMFGSRILVRWVSIPSLVGVLPTNLVIGVTGTLELSADWPVVDDHYACLLSSGQLRSQVPLVWTGSGSVGLCAFRDTAMFETGTVSLTITHDVHEFSIDAGSVQFVPSVSVVKISPSAVEAGVKSVLDIEVDADCDCRAGLECRVGQARAPAMCSAGSRILRCAVVPVGVGVVTFTLMMDGQLLSRNSVHLNVFESVIANVAIQPSAVDSTGGATVTVASSACASGQGRSGGLFVRFGEQGASGYCPYPAVGDAIESSSSLCAVICTAPLR